MTTVVRISQDDERLEAASHWILRMAEGLSFADRRALEAWLSEHPNNAAELIDVARAWDKLDSLGRLADLFPIEHKKPVMPKHRLLPPPDKPWLVAAASTMLIAAVTLLLIPLANFDDNITGNTLPIEERSYETAIGDQLIVNLADGTELSLNTNSQVNVSYSEAARVLWLSRGEIHVQVAHEANRPLLVVVGDRVMQAAGTAFRVEITEGHGTELTVTEGKVFVGTHAAGDNRRDNELPLGVPLVLAESEGKMVAAGEEVILGVLEENVMPVSADEIDVKLSWREGRLIFRSEPLGQALDEVARYTTVEFVFSDEELKYRSLSGRYRTGDVDGLLLALQANFGIRYKYVSEDRVLLSGL